MIVDGAAKNSETYETALSMVKYVESFAKREIVVIPKWQRGGRVSSLNTGYNFAKGEVIMAIDGDTSFDNNMVSNATRHFADPKVACVAGCLRVRNALKNLVTRMQAIEYFFSINIGKTGLSEFNMVNNISGAFGIFRKGVLDKVVGWDAGTAEDLDLTLRIKNYFGRHRDMRIVFDYDIVGHTDVPDTVRGLLHQRMRWDGDLSFIYLKKHRKSFSPQVVGYSNFLYMIINGLMFQLVMPFMIAAYLIFVAIALPVYLSLAIGAITYIFYLFVMLLIWVLAIPVVSERPYIDFSLTAWIPLMPFYSFVMRLNGAFATLWELIGEGHRDTAMAPWWTLKKSKF